MTQYVSARARSWQNRKAVTIYNFILTFVVQGLHSGMNTIHETKYFSEWFEELRDAKGRARIAARIDSAKAGNFGDYKVLEGGICEMRINFGPGYRIYYVQEGLHLYLLIIGGDKSSQKTDITKAKQLWHVIREER
jgi:putative addiction module killer protein